VYYCVSSTRSLKGRGRVAGSTRPLDADWPPRLSIISWGCACYPADYEAAVSVQHHLWHSSGWIHGINVASDVSCVILLCFPADIFVLWASVCLCGRKVSELFWNNKPETWYFNAYHLFRWWNQEKQRLYDWKYVICIYQAFTCQRQASACILCPPFKHIVSALRLHWRALAVKHKRKSIGISLQGKSIFATKIGGRDVCVR